FKHAASTRRGVIPITGFYEYKHVKGKTFPFFIDWMDGATKKAGFKIPLGASAAVVEAGKTLVKTHGADALSKFAKLHFKTTQQITGDLF
ncbi:MAG: SOS response-associated peptidase family protein, partial [bacterium]